MKQRTQRGNYAIRSGQIRCPLMGAIQDEQLALDQNGLSNHGARPSDQATGRYSR
jgi:hypothetical protein